MAGKSTGEQITVHIKLEDFHAKIVAALQAAEQEEREAQHRKDEAGRRINYYRGQLDLLTEMVQGTTSPAPMSAPKQPDSDGA